MAAELSRRALLRWGLAGVGAAALSACANSAGSSGASSTAASSASGTPMPTVGPPPAVGLLSSAEQAGALVEWIASGAAQAGTYGIGGALIDNATGRVLHRIPNQVVRKLRPEVQADAGTSFTYDPTAHGERQLVYWYYQNREKFKLPPASTLTVVTSLDPCAMCTGSLLTAGLNVGVIAPDTFSGINYAEDGKFNDLPPDLQSKALATFAYYAVDAGRGFQGSKSAAFADSKVTMATFQGCETIYQDSAQDVRRTRKGTGTDPKSLQDPMTLPAAAPVVAAYRAAYAGAFSLKLADFRRPDSSLQQLLRSLVDSTPGATNAVAFVDPFGNLVVAAADSPQVSPVATAFMNVAQTYSTVRFGLVDDPTTSAVTQQTITSPKFGTFVWLYAPDPTVSTTIEDLGAYGSTVESALPQTQPSNFQYYLPPRNGTAAQLQQVIDSLPPLYSQLIKISPQQVAQ